MSENPTPAHHVVDIEQRVRDNAGTAALTGALLVVYGFFMFGAAKGEGVFRTGETLFLLSLQLGGLAMLGVATWSAFGHLPSLLADAVVSALVAISLLISAVCLTVGGGFSISYALYAIFAFMLLRSAVGIGMVYLSLRAQDVNSVDEDVEGAEGLAVADGDTSFLSGLQGGRSTGTASAPGEFEPIIFDKTKPPTPKRKAIGDSPDDVIHLDEVQAKVKPPEGHLARLAQRDRKP